LFPFIFTLFQISIYAQFNDREVLDLPAGLSISNQLEYSYDTEEKRKILENWLNLDYTKGIFSTGLRFEVFQPNDPNPSISRGKDRYADIAFKYLKAKLGNRRAGANITVGNFYGSFGRGVIFKSYEDRNIRIDNNLLGISIEADYADFKLKALSGSAANFNDARKDILHAADLEYRALRYLKFGASFASNIPENDNNSATNLMGFRISPNLSFMDGHFEYAVKTNDDIKKSVFNNDRNIAGRAFYGNVNLYFGRFSFLSEMKYYDNFNFTSQDGTVQYNTAPAVIRDYSYILLNRHPHALNQNNEKGFQLEGNYVLSENTNFALSYALTQSIGKNSLYSKVLGIDQSSRNIFKEYFTQIHHKWNQKLKTILTIGYNEEASSNTKNITPVIENNYYIDDLNSIRLIVEHQSTENTFNSEKYYSDVITLEYLRSPNLSVSFVGEIKTSEPVEDKIERKYWLFGQIGYKINDYMDINLLIGSRQAGNICIGGICRYEPEFEGVEVKIITRLY
jgi:hypothetical protein